jgi:hypothetical protein
MSSETSATIVTPKIVSTRFEDCVRSARTFPAKCLLSAAKGATPEELDIYVARLNAADGTLFLDNRNKRHLEDFEVGYRDFQNESGESTYNDAVRQRELRFDRM